MPTANDRGTSLHCSGTSLYCTGAVTLTSGYDALTYVSLQVHTCSVDILPSREHDH